MSGEGNIGLEASLLKFVGPNAPDIQVRVGRHVTVADDDVVVTGFGECFNAIAVLESPPILAADRVTVVPNADGTINIASFKPTGAGDTTPVPATTFSRAVQWIAFGRNPIN